MPKSRKRRKPRAHDPRPRRRVVATIRPGQDLTSLLTPDDVAHMESAIDAAARGDIRGAIEHELAGLVVEESPCLSTSAGGAVSWQPGLRGRPVKEQGPSSICQGGPMAQTGEDRPVRPELPGAAWLLGWASLAGQLVTLADRGTASAESALVSIPLSALVVGWVSFGVLRARMVRTWIAGLILALIALFGLVALVTGPSLAVLAESLTGAVAFGAFLSYLHSDCFARYRAEPDRAGPDLATLVILAVVVGALGGLTATDSGPEGHRSDFHIWIGL